MSRPGRDYLLEAARQLRLALERDVSEDYEEAFNHYQNGVDVLLRGVQGTGSGGGGEAVRGPGGPSEAAARSRRFPLSVEPNRERREAVKRKITQYLRRAEEIFTCHLQRSLGDGSPGGTVSIHPAGRRPRPLVPVRVPLAARCGSLSPLSPPAGLQQPPPAARPDAALGGGQPAALPGAGAHRQGAGGVGAGPARPGGSG